MSNEITITAALSYLNPAQNINTPITGGYTNNQVVPVSTTITGRNYDSITMVVPTSPTAIPLGSVGANNNHIGWCFLRNLDPTYNIDIYSNNANNGVAILRCGNNAPGQVFYFHPTITAPAANANTQPCLLQVVFLDA